MGRVTRAQASKNRAEVVSAAASRFRERGVHAVSIADVMADVGLTTGGFYKQFASKDELFAEATESAMAGMAARRAEFDAEEDVHADARPAFVDFYLSDENRDEVREGCPVTGLASDVARSGAGDAPAGPAYAEGVRAFARWMSADGGSLDLATVSTMVGALVLARATAGTPLSQQILVDAAESVKGSLERPSAK